MAAFNFIVADFTTLRHVIDYLDPLARPLSDPDEIETGNFRAAHTSSEIWEQKSVSGE